MVAEDIKTNPKDTQEKEDVKEAEVIDETEEKTPKSSAEIAEDLANKAKETIDDVSAKIGEIKEEYKSDEKLSETRKQLEDSLNDLYSSFKSKQEEFGKKVNSYVKPVPLTDIIDTEDSIILKSDIPNVNKETININVYEDSIEICYEPISHDSEEEPKYILKERSHGETKRVFELPSLVKHKEAKANYENSVLTIEVPKLKKESYNIKL
ncbi:MAG: Hsp20/alpha crystallin family protein [Methanobacteriaceae archaeon]